MMPRQSVVLLQRILSAWNTKGTSQYAVPLHAFSCTSSLHHWPSVFLSFVLSPLLVSFSFGKFLPLRFPFGVYLFTKGSFSVFIRVIDLAPLQKTNIILCILSTHTNSICLQEKKRGDNVCGCGGNRWGIARSLLLNLYQVLLFVSLILHRSDQNR